MGCSRMNLKIILFAKAVPALCILAVLMGSMNFFLIQIKENNFDPPLAITSFQVFNKNVAVVQIAVIHPRLKKVISETR